MTLEKYMREHFFDNANPCTIVNEKGEELKIPLGEYDSYEFVSIRTEYNGCLLGDDIITVR